VFLAISVTIVVLFVTLIVTVLTPKTYRASSRMTLTVDNKPHVWNAPNDDRRLDLPVLHRVESKETLERVIERLDLKSAWSKRFGEGYPLPMEMVRKYLRSSLDVVFAGNSDIFEIRADSESRQEAAAIANALAESLELPESVGITTLLDSAEIPHSAIRPNLGLNMMVGLVLGVIAGGLLGGAVVFLANRPMPHCSPVRRAF
jgi:capsular polysaccharide biosynthesis protein